MRALYVALTLLCACGRTGLITNFSEGTAGAAECAMGCANSSEAELSLGRCYEAAPECTRFGEHQRLL
ncbi:MAG TPA: hypothetical protein VFG30_11815 [Polyangiales bacterium]|nr:hypothetical protein [Polyangiales bacterium]